MQFEKGVLYVCLLNDKPYQLFYPDEKVALCYDFFQIQSIAEIAGNKARLVFKGHTEFCQNNEVTTYGDVVSFKQASDIDIRLFLDKASGKMSIKEWVKEVQQCINLADVEKKRISDIVRNY